MAYTIYLNINQTNSLRVAKEMVKSDNINGFTQYYRNLLVINELPNQRKEFEAKLPEYINKGIESLKLKNIIPQNVFGKFKS